MASKELFSLGKIYPSDFLKPDEQPRCEPVELKLVMEDDGFVHLDKTAPKEAMWGERYWYASGTNQSMKIALKDVVDSILPHKMDGKWCDIACNDGSLLSFVPDNFLKVGVDPSGGDIHEAANKHGVIYQEYFGETKFEDNYFDVITCIAMLYDVIEIDKFCQEVCRVMKQDGVAVFQMSYTPLMIKQCAFDNLCHEHYSYLDLRSMKNIFERNGMKIVDCTLNDVNGGSFRIFVKKKDASFATQTYRDVCDMRIQSFLMMEEKITWDGFYERVCELKSTVVNFILQAKHHGKTIMGYGSSTKGNTLLQAFGLDNTMIDAIADRQPKKWGLKTVGTNIPIISEEEMRKAKPDYLLVLPWHFISEFKEREAELLKQGTKFIVTMPKFEIIE